MAETNLSPIEQSIGSWTADVSAGNGTVATTPADGWNVQCNGLARSRLVLEVVGGTGGDTIVIAAGDKPPAELNGLGTISQAVAAGERRRIMVEGGRHMRSDGTILVTCGVADTELFAYLDPL